MSGTRTVQQPLNSSNFLAVMAMAAIVLAATIAIAWGATTIGKAAPATLPQPAAISQPLPRDHDASVTGASIVGTSHGAPGAYRPVTSGGSSTLVKDDVAIKTNAQGGFLLGSVGYADQLRMQGTFSSEGAPATRHAGLRAQ